MFIFRGGWRGGRLDICKDGLQVRTLFRLLNSLLHRFGDVIIYVIQTGRFPMIEKKCRLAGEGGYNFHCSAFFIFDTFEKLFDPKAFFVFASSLFRFFLRSLDSAGKLRTRRKGGCLGQGCVARFHGKHARDRKRRYSIFHYLFRPIVYLASFYNGQFTIALHWVGI